MAHHVPDAAALEVVWSKSHHSNPNGECVELATLPDGRIAMRNSRDPHGPAILFSRDSVEELLDSARCGETWIWNLIDSAVTVLQAGRGIIIRGETGFESGPGGPFPQVGLDHHM